MKKLIKPLDIILIVILLLGGTGVYFYTKNTTKSATAVIYIDGEVYKAVSLEQVETAYEISLPCSPAATLLVEKGSICFKAADCSDKVCINSGKLRHRGDTAACLPAKAVVTIENGEESEIDALVY
ncbi:MAG: NusG domain II-containing protein [Clostridia bacterium]|nr:NusG domain II-containing protein [Clostridia bacterium]